MTYETSPPPPIVPVQIPEINRLAQMPDFDVRAAVEVGDGAGDLQDAVVGAGGSNIIVQTFHNVRGQDKNRIKENG